MKTQLRYCFVVLWTLLAFNTTNASTNPINRNTTGSVDATNLPGRPGRRVQVNSSTSKQIAKTTIALHSNRNLAVLDSVTKLLRLKLIIDSLNYDDIAIGFNSGASTTYDGNEDSEYFPGINAPEGLASFSSDGVALAVNFLPLPKKSPLIIRLDVEAINSGAFTLERTKLDALPAIYEVWLMDRYKKDSLDIKANSSYAFTINKKDTASFGKNRFYVVVRQNVALSVQLTDFTATKESTGAQVAWKTTNEQSNTEFAVERSADDGVTFKVIDSLKSSAVGTYSYLDKTPPIAADQYRLKMEDINGNIIYSKAITLIFAAASTSKISNAGASNPISVYPNPARSVISYAINSNDKTASNSAVIQSLSSTSSNNQQSYSIKIITSNGAVIKTETASEPNSQQDISTLRAGTYIIQVLNNKDKSVVGQSKFIKL